VLTTQRANLQVLAEFLVVGVCTIAFTLTMLGIFVAMLGRSAPGAHDFVEYWASGHQLAHHANPYDGDAILQIERSVGFPTYDPVLIMWNPPSALLLVLPLGFIGPRAGGLLWSLLILASLVASVRMIWTMHGRPRDKLHLLGYSFAPALICVLAAQVSIFVLLGLVLFLRLHRSRPFVAGASLWLCMLKPHLFLPFGLVLIVWAIITRSYKVLAGVTVALAVSTAIAYVLDPLAWTQYAQMMSSTPARVLPIPCLSIELRRLVSPHSLWLQYLPATVGCVWAITYFRKHCDDWDWMAHGSLLMLVSFLVAPYSWLMDQAILIPALLHAAFVTRSRNHIAVLALASAIIEFGALRGVEPWRSAFFLWTAPAWLVWYLSATRPRNAKSPQDPLHIAGEVSLARVEN
jgi:Glycosyltransferase family 87